MGVRHAKYQENGESFFGVASVMEKNNTTPTMIITYLGRWFGS